MTIWPLFIGIPILILFAYFLIKLIKKANQEFLNNNLEINNLLKKYSFNKGYKYYEKDEISLINKISKFQKSFPRKFFKWRQITNILFSREDSFYIFKTNTLRSQSSLSILHTVCIFENNIDYKNNLWLFANIISSIDVNNTVTKKFIDIANKLLSPRSKREVYKFENTIDLDQSFFTKHNVFFTNYESCSKFITNDLIILISKIEKEIKIPISVEIINNRLVIYTSSISQSNQNTTMCTENELNIFIKYSLMIKKYFINY